MNKKLEIYEKKQIKSSYYLFCPICEKKIKGISKNHCIGNFQIHFQTSHPNKSFGKFLFEEPKKRNKNEKAKN